MTVMKKMIILMLLFWAVGATGQIRDEGELGWTQSDLEESRVTVNLITDKDEPDFIRIQGAPGTDPCYISTNKIKEFKKYLDKLIKEAEKLDQEANDNMSDNDSKEMDIPSPDVLLIWQGKMFYNDEKEFRKKVPLKAEWIFYRSEEVPAGTFVTITAEAADPTDPMEVCKFKMWVTIDELKFLQDKILVKKDIDRFVIYYRNKDRLHYNNVQNKMKSMQRGL